MFRGTTVHLPKIDSVGNQPTDLRKISKGVYRRQSEPSRELRDLPAQSNGQWILQKKKPRRPSLHGCFETGRHLIGSPCLKDHKSRRPGLGGYPKLLQCRRRKGRVRVQQHCDSFIAWDELLQDLQLLADNVTRLGAHPGDVGAGSAKAFNQSRTEGVGHTRQYDRNRRGCCLRRHCASVPMPVTSTSGLARTASAANGGSRSGTSSAER